ncbi:hypothetical protein N2152v2_010016 [Parachlorella kessleri]
MDGAVTIGDRDAQQASFSMPLPTFSAYCNARRLWGDRAHLSLVLIVTLSAVGRCHQACLPLERLGFAVYLLGVAGCLAWAHLQPCSYVRWRELSQSLVRIAALSVQVSGACVVIAVFRGAEPPWQRGTGPREHGMFLLSLLLATNVVGLVQFSLASRLRLPVHTVTQAAALAVTLSSIPSLCSCSTMQLAPSRRVVHTLHSAIDLLSCRWAFSGFAKAAAEPPSPVAECWAVVAAVQVLVGFVLPEVLLAVWECRDFHHFKERTGGRYQRSFCAWLYANFTDQPQEQGWVRWSKLLLAGLVLFSTVWDILLNLAAGMGAKSGQL